MATSNSYAAEIETLELPGLAEPVEIVVDRWGVPHIVAQNEHDLFFAQGFHAARERTFQFEIWRRQATGAVAEILGRRELLRDKGARLLRFRGDLKRELNHYHPRGEAIVTAFVEGINAWIDIARREPERLSIEFELLGIKPERWTPEVVISRHQGLVRNLTEELQVGRSVSLLGPDKVRELVDFHPGEPEIALDPAIDGTLLFADILAPYRAARSEVRFRAEDLVNADDADDPDARGASLFPFEKRGAHAERADEAGPFDDRDIGSNNWVLAGTRTKSGMPILANDPHRVLGVPSLRTFAHLTAPGWNVIGGGEPVLPGVSIGHNEHGAWGLTIFRIDCEDLYVYETNPDDPLQYKYGDGWERMTTIREEIPVKGEKPHVVELRFTRHGPVLHENREHNTAYALRAGWQEVGGAPYLASLRMNVARDWESFREACSYSHIPGENMIWADRDGHIGWQAVGIAPLRKNWNGMLPVPGDGRYEWEGYLPIRDLPHLSDPEQAYWNTSNEHVTPEGYAHRRAIGWTWTDPYRGDRVREVLDDDRDHTVEHSVALQVDQLSIPARKLVPLLRDVAIDDPKLNAARALFDDWDFVLARDSTAAGLYAMWERRLETNVRSRFVPSVARRYLPTLSMRNIIGWLSDPDERFGENPPAARDELLRKSLAEAVAEMTERFGPETANWRYGDEKFKHAHLKHALSDAVDDETRKRLDVGPLPRGGNSYTVDNTGRDDRQPTGGTFRVVIDTADWDESRATNSPGQSGDPASPHYGDLFKPWAEGEFFPLLYSRDKIEAAAARKIQLKPISEVD
ncbi:MAG: penicillin acylase family protein [Planctomycetaceae bacterium]